MRMRESFDRNRGGLVENTEKLVGMQDRNETGKWTETMDVRVLRVSH